jgi:hypothetical protein
MDPQAWQQFVNEHGGLIGNPAPIDPEIEAPTTRTVTVNGQQQTVEIPGQTSKAPNPDPYYRYTFKDGSVLEAKGGAASPGAVRSYKPGPKAAATEAKPQKGDTKQTVQGNRLVTETWTGTAWSATGATNLPPTDLAARTPSSPSQLQIITDPTTGRPIKYRDPNTGQVIDLPDAKDPARPQVIQGPRGEVLSWDGTKLTVLRAGEPEKPAAVGVRVIGNQLVDDTGKVVFTAPGKAVIHDAGDQILSIDEAGHATVIYTKPSKPTVLSGGGQRPLIDVQGPDGAISAVKDPAYTAPSVQALQNYYDGVGYVQGLIEKHQMSPAEGTAYMDALKQQLDAVQQGTTPYQQAQDRQKIRENQATLGRTVLENKVANTKSLADSLLGYLKPTGVNFDFSRVDPFGFADQTVTRQMGGPDVTGAAAKALLAALTQSTTGPAPAPAYAGPAPAPAPAADPTDIAAALARLTAGVGQDRVSQGLGGI